jgi:hypothetical protein
MSFLCVFMCQMSRKTSVEGEGKSKEKRFDREIYSKVDKN